MYPNAYVKGPLPMYRGLTDSITTSVAIVGGGVTGLSLSYHLQNMGIESVVIEAEQLGSGASGLNGGQVNGGTWYDPQAIEKILGKELGHKFTKFIYDAPSYVFNLVETLSLDCEAKQSGTVRAAYEESYFKYLELLAADYEQRGIQITPIYGKELHQKTGHSGYQIGLYDPNAGSINPLSYVLELAKHTEHLGAKVFCKTPVTAIEKVNGRFLLKTCSPHTVTSDKVVVCSNAYSSKATSSINKHLQYLYAAIIVSDPFSQEDIPNFIPTYETTTIPNFYRRDVQGRILFGGITARPKINNPNQLRSYVRSANKKWPKLDPYSWKEAWSGRLGFNSDMLPHVYESQKGLLYCAGYSGRGVGLGTVLGHQMAKYIYGVADNSFSVPFCTPKTPSLMNRLKFLSMRKGLLLKEIYEQTSIRGRIAKIAI